jgi:apolipoprotein N-acyltransferase
MDFPDKVSQTGKNGVDLLFSPSNEWENIIPVHAQMAVFRGIENGSSTIHPASMGLSVIADSRGRIMAEENWYDSEKKSITGSVPVKGTKTVYSLIGDLFPLLIMISTAALIIYSIILGTIRFKKKRASKGGIK